MYSFFSTFDYTDPSMSLARRPSTVVAQQALFMMNSPLVASQSERMAKEILSAAEASQDRLDLLYENLFSRFPSESERVRMLQFISKIESSGVGAHSVQWNIDDAQDMNAEPQLISSNLHAWRSLCRVLMSSNEFIYID